MVSRRSAIKRETQETNVSLELVLDGAGSWEMNTGIRMFDHLLSQIARHGLFDIKISATGNDQHHLVEDVGICLGKAFSEALGERLGIIRMSDSTVPMDDALAMVALDISGRGYTVLDLPFKDKEIGFSWLRINFLGFFASFNKGISGGGYGPIITSGQILSGLDSKSSVSISSFTEAITCLVALLVYLLKVKAINFMPVLPLLFGSVIAIPLAVRMVKKSDGKKHVIAIGVITVSLGLATLVKVI